MTNDEQKLIALITAKDFRGLEELIELFGADILRTIQYILNHPAEKSYIEDVQNKVFYQLWEELPTYDPTKSSLKTFITIITKHLALDQKRQIIRNLKIEPMENPEANESFEETYFEKSNFLQLLSSLSLEDQLIFLKFYYYQDSVINIAKDLALSKEIIYNRLSRGRKALKEQLINERGELS